ncbi:MAG: hypothetical protein KDK56_07310 [Simkania sp.]|nr:hypothetical protein [Simkania sp.]MCP5489492.1 hypothetical protein [Chlamydiales bacterium]
MIKNYLPDWLNKKYEEKEMSSNKREKIADFLDLIQNVWCISNQDYQNRIWVQHETQDIVDSFCDTRMYFSEDAEAVLEAYEEGRVKMTDQQHKMLKKLYEMVDNYEPQPEIPFEFRRCRDQQIVNDPNWNKIRDFAKLVYEELIK